MQDQGERSAHIVEGILDKTVAPMWQGELKKRLSVRLNLYLECLWVNRKCKCAWAGQTYMKSALMKHGVSHE